MQEHCFPEDTLARTISMNKPSPSAVNRARKYVYDLLLSPAIDTRTEYWMRVSIAVLIFVNVLIVILETVQEVHDVCHEIFHVIEVFSIIVFSVEYVLRLWAIVEHSQFRHPLWGRVRYFFTFFALIDLLAILPFFLPHLISADLLIVRALRLFRLIRVLKLGRYSTSFEMMGRVLRKKREEMFSSMFVLVIILIISSSLMYFIEHEAQPKAFPNIPAALWWGVATLTTIGYGDIYPITALGKVFAAISAILSVGIVALPSGIIVTGFIEEMQTRLVKKENLPQPRQCPHCGKIIEQQ